MHPTVAVSAQTTSRLRRPAHGGQRADDCCWAATPARDGGLPCDWALSCSDASSNDELIAPCQTFTALFPLNPACQ